jgi:template-activating factor I
VAEVDGDDDDDMPAEAGSFFNFFEVADDPFEVSGVSAATGA